MVAACDGSTTPIDGLSCTLTNSGTQFDTTIDFEKGKMYGDAYMHIYKDGSPIHFSVCSAKIPI